MFKGILTFISYALRSIILVTIDTFCVYRMHCKLLNWGTIKIQGIQILLPTKESVSINVKYSVKNSTVDGNYLHFLQNSTKNANIADYLKKHLETHKK